MDLGSQRALPLAEAALAQLAGRSSLSFHRPGGMLVRSPGASEDAYRQVVQLAVDGQLLADPAATQRLIVMAGNALNSPLMDELDNLGGRALQTYQLQGLQMQLRIMAG